ncbi:unnamed protein product [Gordionus sp. m RMFG-2023]|uniref:peptidyl-alpha-hydroxyglycine alpha-amidating lyase 2-like n=1 Tax=Gordionus sp. m RMFG-2023 TaxID=3053472 RepID=UPI0030E1333A
MPKIEHSFLNIFNLITLLLILSSCLQITYSWNYEYPALVDSYDYKDTLPKPTLFNKVNRDELENGESHLIKEWVIGGKVGKNVFGECSGISFDNKGDLYVLHRGKRIWDINSFNHSHFNHINDGPIKEKTLLKLNPKDGKIVDSYFSKKFYMPHGLTIDQEDNVWITDVAMHQVFKYEMGNFAKPSLVLGTKFKAGHDNYHFCQPTDVAVSSTNGQFFVSDGYCNHRIIKYDANGNIISIFGKSDSYWLGSQRQNFLMTPHSLALIQNLDLICVADRENSRILCLKAGVLNMDNLDIYSAYNNPRLTNFLPRFSYKIVDNKGHNYRPYAISYCTKDGKMYVLCQSDNENTPFIALSGELSLQDDTLNSVSWYQFPISSRPHDLTVEDIANSNDKNIYVADLSQMVWKLKETGNE